MRNTAGWRRFKRCKDGKQNPTQLSIFSQLQGRRRQSQESARKRRLSEQVPPQALGCPTRFHRPKVRQSRAVSAKPLSPFINGGLWRLDVFQKCSGRRPLLPLNALEGHQKVAQCKRRAGATGPPFPPRAAPGQRSDQFFSSPPESPAFGRFGGRGRERGSFVAEWRVSRFVVV